MKINKPGEEVKDICFDHGNMSDMPADLELENQTVETGTARQTEEFEYLFHTSLSSVC